MKLHAEPFGASAEEVKYFAELCSSGSLEEGQGGTFDQLADHLRQIARRLPSTVYRATAFDAKRMDLTPLAAAGLVIIMIGAVGYDPSRRWLSNGCTAVCNCALALFVAYGRWRVTPLGTPHTTASRQSMLLDIEPLNVLSGEVSLGVRPQC